MRSLGRITARLVPLALFVMSASARAADVIEYYDTDAVGNVRLVTDAAGNVVERHDYLPFGEEWCGTSVCGANRAPGEPLRFTGKERDAETGLDYFGARYYRANAGRFTTVDPVMNAKASLVDPQRWNRYAYALNNPLKVIDPDGREPGASIFMPPPRGMSLDKYEALTLWQHEQDQQLLLPSLAAGLAGLAAPAVVEAAGVELAIAAGRCMASSGCQNAARGAAEGVSGAPPGAMGTLPGFAAGKLAKHFEKHAAEFGFRTAEEYLQSAQNLVRGGEGVETSVRSGNGDRLFYDAAKNEFAALTKNNVIKTYFRPIEGKAYWAGQKGE